jgi:hypothetical protein
MDYNKLNNPIQIDSKLLSKSNEVEFTKNIKINKKKNDITAILAQKIFSLNNYQTLKFSPDLILYLMNQLELLVNKSDGIDKKEVILDILKMVFNLNEPELKLADDLIEFIHSNNLIIKRGIFRFFNCLKKKVNY